MFDFLKKKHIDDKLVVRNNHKIERTPWIYCNYCGMDLTKAEDRCIFCSNEPSCPVCRKTMKITTDDNTIIKLECINPKCNHVINVKR